MNIALIPARGGSKSIRKKNIIKLGKFPLIYYTIEVAKKSKLIDRIIVSTDDEKIKELGLKYGAEAPFFRPKEFAKDLSPDLDVVYHFLTWLKKNKEEIPDMITFLRPDFPFRKSEVIDEAIKIYINDKSADGLKSVRKSKEIPHVTCVIKSDYLQPVMEFKKVKKLYGSARQLFPTTYYPIGYIDIYDSQLVLTKKTLFGRKMLPYLIEENLINIGSYEELQNAEEIIKKFKIY